MAQADQNLPNKILVVDDDPSVAGALEEPLSRYNVRMDKATNLDTALYLFNTQRYDVVLIEIEFAPLAGLGLVQKWRAHDVEDRRCTAFVMLSGNKSLGNNEGLIRELGDLEVLTKPCSAIQVLPYLSRGMATKRRLVAYNDMKTKVLSYYDKTKNFDKAAEQVKSRLPTLGPKGLHLLYDLYEKGGRFEEALAIVSPMLERDPADIALLNAKGRLLMRLGRFADAEAHGDMEIYWGAYLGTPDEILISGKVADVATDIHRRRHEARQRNGWIMDTYLMRKPSRSA